MKIAVIGWGSLIWRPGELLIASRWHKDGPTLPVEFARVSDDGRLTLVIVEGTGPVTTLWAMSGHENLDDAVTNLGAREGTPRRNIASITTGQHGVTALHETVRNWVSAHALDAAVWTTLGPRRPNHQDGVPGVSEVVEHIRSLNQEAKHRAEEYVRNTPSQVETEMRRVIRCEFGWENNALAPVLFEE